MKGLINFTLDNNTNTYHVRVRMSECGFQDEFVLKMKPKEFTDYKMSTADVTLLSMSCGDTNKLNKTETLTAEQLLNLLFVGGY